MRTSIANTAAAVALIQAHANTITAILPSMRLAGAPKIWRRNNHKRNARKAG